MKKLVSLFAAGLVTLAMSFIGCSAESGGGRSVKTPEAPVITGITSDALDSNGCVTYTAGNEDMPELTVNVNEPTDGAVLSFKWEWKKGNGEWTEFTNCDEESIFIDFAESGTYKVRVTVTASIGMEEVTAEKLITVRVATPALPDPCAVTVTVAPSAAEFTSTVIIIELTATVLKVDASDTGLVTYQWLKDGVEIENAVTSKYSITETGSYKVKVTNTLNGKTKTAESNVVEATKEATAEAPSITKQPEVDEPVLIGNTVKLSVEATVTDGGVLSYQWYKNDNAIAAATNFEYIVDTTVETKLQAYYCMVKNTLGEKSSATKSDVVIFQVKNPEKTYAAKPILDESGMKDATYIFGAAVTPLTVAATVSDGGVLSYKWYVNGEVDAAKTTNSYSVNSSVPGTYEIQVEVVNYLETATAENKEESKTSKVYTIVVDPQVNAKEPVINGVADDGTKLTVTAKSVDKGTLTYQWYKDGNPITNATSATYEYAKSPAGTYRYTVKVTNTITDNSDGGEKSKSKTSEEKVVVIAEELAAPVVTVESVAAKTGVQFTLTAEVENKDSSATYTYQWLDDDMNAISGANAATYSDTKSDAKEYKYSVQVTVTKDGKSKTTTKTAVVNVTAPSVTVKSVTITSATTVDAGKNLELTGKAVMSDNTEVTSGITFKIVGTSDKASISGNVLTALKAGTVTIRATYDGVSSEDVEITIAASESTGNGGISIDFN